MKEATTFVEMRITRKGAGTVHNGRALKAGDLVQVTAVDAVAWHQRGDATYTTPVEVLHETLLIGQVVYSRGDTAYVSPERAEALEAGGAARVLPEAKASAAPKTVPLHQAATA